MKTLLIGLLSLVSSAALAVELSDIAGKYEVTTDLAPVAYIINISKSGKVKLTETSPYGTLECSGAASIDNDIVTSEVTCQNGASFTQIIDLSATVLSNEFEANVYSSLYETELPMNFKKLK